MAIAFVQQTAGSAADGGSVAYGSNVGSGVLLVACILAPGAASEVDSVTDTLGNTWTLARRRKGTAGGAGTNRNSEIWYAPCASGGACTVTVGVTVAGTQQISLSEFSGFSGGVTLGQVGDNEVTSASTNQPNGSITTTEADEVIVATWSTDNGFTVSSRATGFASFTAGSRRESQYKITGVETTDAQVIMTDSLKSVSVIASFFPTAGGGGGTANPWYYYAQQ